MRCIQTRPTTIALAIAAALAVPATLRAEAEPDADPQRQRRDSRTLERVDVEAQAAKRFKPDVSTTGLKGGGELRDTPQAITVVPQALIESQAAATLVEALRNVAGLTLASGEGGNTGDNITIRGFAARTDQYVDGVRDNGQYIRDTYNIERIEVLKGPSSMLFGRGGTGGVVNTVTKRPTGQELRALTLMAGSEDFLRGTADLDQPVGPDAGVRLNLLWNESDSFRDTVEYERRAIAPSVRFDVSEVTRIDATVSYLDHDGILDYGLPFNLATGEPIDVPIDLNYGAGDQSTIEYEVFEGRVAFEHEFAQGLALPAAPVFDPQSVVLPTLPSSFEGAALADSSKVDTDTQAYYATWSTSFARRLRRGARTGRGDRPAPGVARRVNLAGGATGKQLVAASTVAPIAMAITGIWLWVLRRAQARALATNPSNPFGCGSAGAAAR